MTTASKRAASRKGGGSTAARAEKKGRNLNFEGLTLEIPPKLPSSFAYRFAKISALEARGDDASGGVYELLTGIIGEEQFDKVADHVDGLKKQVSLSDLIVALLTEYGVASGN